MNNLMSHHKTLQISQKPGSPPKSAPGSAPLRSLNRRHLLWIRQKYSGDPPLCAARADDNLMSEEPWVDERG